MEENFPKEFEGLTPEQVQRSRASNGENVLKLEKSGGFFHQLFDILQEPMILLLIAVVVIYISTGNYNEALFMGFALLIVLSISIYQDNRSKSALKALQQLTAPRVQVIREGKLLGIAAKEVVVGDFCTVREGESIAADGTLRFSTDFTVDESLLTGESFSVSKDAFSEDNRVLSGTVVLSGYAVYEVTSVGDGTKLGQIGASITSIEKEKSPLQIQISKFVRSMAVIGVAVFAVVWGVSYYNTNDLVESLLAGLTLAMSILPEEIPVAFTTFMALGAWKLLRQGIVIKRASLVETLGSTTILCTDKTGTITENRMELEKIFRAKSSRHFKRSDFDDPELNEIIWNSLLASEPVAFDTMEMDIHSISKQQGLYEKRNAWALFHEYPLEGKPPMMTHVWKTPAGELIAAVKGAPEALLEHSHLALGERIRYQQVYEELASQGLRVLGVGTTRVLEGALPVRQQDITFEFLGFLAFEDPPKAFISDVFKELKQAGIVVKVITGDNELTTKAVAQKAGISEVNSSITGTELMELNPQELARAAKQHTLFTRMFPEAKLRIIQSLKEQGEIVAMIGDGVNDAPALRSAHIGVAMGHKGTEIAKQAASMVLSNDSLEGITEGVKAGRRIYSNLKKAIQYIISIHIPIVVVVSIPLILGWMYPHIFSPLHVIFLELVMGPTCSIVFENEPLEKRAMKEPPRPISETFFSRKELFRSVVQGAVIAGVLLVLYQYSINAEMEEDKLRSLIFSTLVLSNVFLSFVNRSSYHTIVETFSYKNPLLYGISIMVLGLLFSLLYFEPARSFFELGKLTVLELLQCTALAFISVAWLDLQKIIMRKVRKSA